MDDEKSAASAMPADVALLFLSSLSLSLFPSIDTRSYIDTRLSVRTSVPPAKGSRVISFIAVRPLRNIHSAARQLQRVSTCTHIDASICSPD